MELRMGDRIIGENNPVFVIAEVSANHNQKYDLAVETIKAAKEAGADAVKMQTYTPDTITLDCDNEYFQIKHGTIWDGRTLYHLYQDAYTPWEWQPELKKLAEDLGLIWFSSPFDKTAVDFLGKMDVPAYKIASFELVDIQLIQYVAQKGKPIIMSTGMATLAEIDEAITAAREAGCKELALLKCTSAYPASPLEMNLRTIPHVAEAFGVPVGLSDHTLGIAVPVAAVALGACIVEKHIILSRNIPGSDSAFSLEPNEFKAMVEAIHTTGKALGKVNYEATDQEAANRIFRRSLFVVKDMKAGEVFTEENVKSIRPGNGLHTRYLENVIGFCSSKEICRGTPLSWDLVQQGRRLA
jgi:pseudaminic acid synthase